MKTSRFFASFALLLGSAIIGNATIIGFGQLGGNNTGITELYPNLGSNAVADGNGFVVTNGTTPNISLKWGAEWDIHTSSWFDPLESQTVGGGSWDSENQAARIAQLDVGSHSIVFSADPGYALQLISFDFAHTNEQTTNTNADHTTSWNLTLSDSSSNVVWSDAIRFSNGQVFTVSPGFTGESGESYTLLFERTAESYGSNGRHGIDNLTFNQVVIPEPGAVALLSVSALGMLARRRK